MKHSVLSFKFAGVLLLVAAPSSQAGTINWGGAFFTQNYSSDATDLETGATATSPLGEVLYELGIFQSSDGTEFTPTFDNIEQWEANWVPLYANDFSITTASSEYDSATNYFGDVVSVGSDTDQVSTLSSSSTGGTLVSGYQVYIWGFDTRDLSGGATPEWVLMTGSDSGASGPSDDNWVLPDSTTQGNDSFDIQWDVASASVAIVGQIDDGRGAGNMIDPAVPFGTSDHQFATVPEPGALVLTSLSILALLRRRR